MSAKPRKLVPYFAGARTKRKSSRPSARTTLALEKRINTELVRQLMHDHVVSTSRRMPSDESLAKLASTLEFDRLFLWHGQHIAPLELAIAKCVEPLVELLEELRKKYIAENASPRAFLRRRTDAIDAALSAFDRLYDAAVVFGVPPLQKGRRAHSFMRGWIWLANQIPIDFEKAMRSTNPEYRIRVSRKGPLVSFIAALVPHLTGEHPTMESVAAILKKQKKRASQWKLRNPLPAQG